ncbi:MAG: SDR family NAD(P)-dependent oxidoreductase [Chitinophagaceae bacterium]
MQPVILITGINGQLGQVLAQHFLSIGYLVLGTCRPGTRTETKLSSSVTLFEVDLTHEVDCQHVFGDILQQFPNIDALVAAAGGFTVGKISSFRMADWHRMVAMNFETALNAALPVFKHMLHKKSGRIFLFGAQAGLHTEKASGAVAYGWSKSLIFHLAAQLNLDAADCNVVTSVVVPSTIDTATNRQAMPTANFEKWVSPQAIAEAIAFYCSDAASQIREPVIKVYNQS